MCTNAALDRMECYMDQLIDSFEEFVRKSLIMISVAIVTVLLLLAYIFRAMVPQTRRRRRHNTAQAEIRPHKGETEKNATKPCTNTQCTSKTSVASNTRQRRGLQQKECVYPAIKKSNSILKVKPKVDTPVQMSNKPSESETFLKEIAYSNCSKSCITSHKMEPSCSSRLMLPSLPPCALKSVRSNQKCCSPAPPRLRTSCCSLCCADNEKL